MSHKATIRPVPAYRRHQMLDPIRYPDWEAACPCGFSETYSKFSSAEDAAYAHEMETGCHCMVCEQFLWGEHIDGYPIESPPEEVQS